MFDLVKLDILTSSLTTVVDDDVSACVMGEGGGYVYPVPQTF